MDTREAPRVAIPGRWRAHPDTSAALVRLADHWYVACRSDELDKRPLAREVLGLPLVLFRGEGRRAAALVDRCPHRNVPLSIGRVDGGLLECKYHGWKFDAQGSCREIPGICGGPADLKARRATALHVREQDGLVWVFANPEAEPPFEPMRIPHVDDPRYCIIRRSFTVRGTLYSALENTLDVPHTAFLHQGLFRGPKKRNEIDVVIRRGADRVEAEFIGEPRPTGIAGRLLAPRGGVVQHVDRFLLPSVAQVEYRLEDNHVLITAAMTPVSDFETTIHATVAFKLRIPGWLVRPVLTPIAFHILNQDAEILKIQTSSLQRFGGEKFTSTELDVLGAHIWKLLRQAEKGVTPPADEVHEQRVRMRV